MLHFKLYFLMTLYAVAIVISCDDAVPFIMWSSDTHLDLETPSLRHYSTEEFGKISSLALTSKPVVIGVQESLSLEDLRFRDEGNQGHFPLLQNAFLSAKSNLFIPYIKNPVIALQSLDNTHDRDVAFGNKIDGKSQEDGNIHIIKLDDGDKGEERANVLRKHDKIMFEACENTRLKYGSAVCILTAERKSWIEPEGKVMAGRKLLQIEEGEERKPSNGTAKTVYYHKNVGMIYSEFPPTLLNIETNVSETLEMAGTHPTFQEKTLWAYVKPKTTSKGEGRTTLRFKFITDKSTWSLPEVECHWNHTYTFSLKPNIAIKSSLGNSFHTPSYVVFYGQNYNLTFKNFQAQYFKDQDHDPVFGMAEDTVYFFTIPILSGIFVVALVLSIVFWGLAMIFDIRTMDRFDDPKGKTVTISATD